MFLVDARLVAPTLPDYFPRLVLQRFPPEQHDTEAQRGGDPQPQGGKQYAACDAVLCAKAACHVTAQVVEAVGVGGVTEQ